MDELPVGEVVQVPADAGQDEPGGHRERLLAASRAVLVEEPGLVREPGLVVGESPRVPVTAPGVMTLSGIPGPVKFH